MENLNGDLQKTNGANLEMTTALHRISTSGHQYLDTESGDIDLESLQVVLSFDEYPLSFWEEHFKAINS
jgi:hypothetical protein